jgi:hypothetical protein
MRESARCGPEPARAGYAVTTAVAVTGEILMEQDAPDLYCLARGTVSIYQVLGRVPRRPAAFSNTGEVRVFQTYLRERAAQDQKHEREKSEHK